MNVYNDTEAEEIIRNTYNNIVYGDREAERLHNHLVFNEHYDSANVAKAWNIFYDRIQYLEDICDYAGIKPIEES